MSLFDLFRHRRVPRIDRLPSQRPDHAVARPKSRPVGVDRGASDLNDRRGRDGVIMAGMLADDLAASRRGPL